MNSLDVFLKTPWFSSPCEWLRFACQRRLKSFIMTSWPRLPPKVHLRSKVKRQDLGHCWCCCGLSLSIRQISMAFDTVALHFSRRSSRRFCLWVGLALWRGVSSYALWFVTFDGWRDWADLAVARCIWYTCFSTASACQAYPTWHLRGTHPPQGCHP